MNNDAQIMERLDQIEAQLAPLAESFKGVSELRKDMAPVAKSAIRLLIKELEDVESGFQLEDVAEMIKEFMRSIRYITSMITSLGAQPTQSALIFASGVLPRA